MAKDYIKGTDSVPKVGRFGSNYSLIIHEGPCSTSLFRGLLFHADLLQMTKQTWGKSKSLEHVCVCVLSSPFKIKD